MLKNIVNFIWNNYNGFLGYNIKKADIQNLVIRYRHRIVIAQNNDGDLISLLFYLKEGTDLYIIGVIRKPEFTVKAMKDTLRDIAKNENCNTLVIYRNNTKARRINL